jgi:hypothetical protein
MSAARWLPVAMLAASTAASNAAAQGTTSGNMYTCRDHSGRTVTSDRPIPDCAGVMRELGPSGVVKREIAPPMTPEQQRQKEAEDRARRTVDETVREQHRRDLALLTAYQNEDQIEAARKRALADANDAIKTSQERLDDLQKDKKALEHEGETYKGKPVSPLYQRRVEDNQMLINDEDAAIKQRRVDVERINQRYDDDRKRFRELSATRGK